MSSATVMSVCQRHIVRGGEATAVCACAAWNLGGVRWNHVNPAHTEEDLWCDRHRLH